MARLRRLQTRWLLVCLFVLSSTAGCTKNAPKLTKKTLDESVAAARAFLLEHQTERGDFTYEYDVSSKETTLGGSQVRQAGALWGLALAHHAEPDDTTRKAIERGLAFWEEHSAAAGERRWPVYPDDQKGSTGTAALVLLSTVDFLRADHPNPERARWEKLADGLTAFLLSLRRDDGHFHERYDLTTGRGSGRGSPYFDGETLLALAKSARFRDLGEELKPVIMHSAERLHEDYVVEARKLDDDSATTKGFYQWGSMSFREIHAEGWDDGDVFAKRTIDLAHWMIDVHRTLNRRKNTAYAQEGIATAYELAGKIGDDAARKKFRGVIDAGLSNLIRWQIGGPNPNGYAQRFADDPRARGGEMNAKNDGVLRIDVTQHQLHAMILARRYVFDGP